MNYELNSVGKMRYSIPQQVWTGDDTMQISQFAGHDMMVIAKSDEEPHLFELHYIGYQTGGFLGMETAKGKAAEFAKLVLNELLSMLDQPVNNVN